MYIHINVYIRSLIIHNKKNLVCLSFFLSLFLLGARNALTCTLNSVMCLFLCFVYHCDNSYTIRYNWYSLFDRSQHMQNALIHSLWPWLTHYLSCVRNIMKFEFDERVCFCPNMSRFYLTSLSNFEHWTNKLSNYADPVQGKQLQQPHQYTPINNNNNNNN